MLSIPPISWQENFQRKIHLYKVVHFCLNKKHLLEGILATFMEIKWDNVQGIQRMSEHCPSVYW